jgi:hypothetical protein
VGCHARDDLGVENGPRLDREGQEAIMIALMRMEDKLEEILRVLLGEDDGEEELDS